MDVLRVLDTRKYFDGAGKNALVNYPNIMEKEKSFKSHQ